MDYLLHNCISLLTILKNNTAYIPLSLYLLWYIQAYLSKTRLIGKDGSHMKELIEKFKSLQTGYKPTIWCFPSILNTIVFSLIQRSIKHNYEREILKTPDGGQIAIDWLHHKLNRDKCKNKLVMLVLPGTAGSSKANYVSHFIEKARQMGCVGVVMNYRGIEVDLLTSRTYCATNHDDLILVIERIKTVYPDYCIFAIGVSLGGIQLGGYLAKKRDLESPISYAMIISAPFSPFHSYDELEKSKHIILNRFLTNKVARYLEKHKSLFVNDELYDVHKIKHCKSIRELDTHFVVKQFGYETCEDYYKDASLDHKIQDIRTPTLFLNAADDMFSPERAIPLDKFTANPNTALVMTKYGGHISFVEGLIPTGCNYACRLLNDYLTNILNELKLNK